MLEVEVNGSAASQLSTPQGGKSPSPSPTSSPRSPRLRRGSHESSLSFDSTKEVSGSVEEEGAGPTDKDEPDLNKAVPEVLPEVVPEGVPEVVPVEVLEVVPVEVPVVVPEMVSEETPVVVPEMELEGIPELVPEVVPEVVPEEIPEVVLEGVPEVVPEETPEVVLEGVPEVVSEEIPEVVLEGVPEVVPEETPEVVPAVVPAVPAYIAERYTVGRTLGDGNFAVVRECVERSTGREYALKIINKGKCRGKEHMIQNEVSILRRVKHPNVVLLIEEVDTYSQLYLVMELVKGGDLFDAITSTSRYTERDASGMLHNLANAIRHLHSLNIVHRDIKPENLLVYEHADGSKSLKLGDFGLATVVDGPLYTVCGTPTYVAPEIIAETGYGLKVDIWAAGVITYILLCGFPPFRGSSEDQEALFDQILMGQLEFPLPYWDHVSHTAKELIRFMLEVEVDQRYSALQVLEHPWVNDDGLSENDHQLSVAGKIKKHFNTGPRTSDTPAGVAVITLDDTFSMQRSGSLDFYQHPTMYWIRPPLLIRRGRFSDEDATRM